jgi:hypothetical protein
MTGFTSNINTGNLNAVGLANIVGNINGGNITTVGLVSATGNVTGNYFIGNGSQLTGLAGGTSVINGTSNVVVAANGNISLSVAGTSNVGLFTTTGFTTSGNISLIGNIVDTGALWINTTANGNITLNANGTGQTLVTTGLSVTGNIVAGNVTATTITETSSIQFKENIRPLANPLLAISQLAGVTYDRRDGTSKDEVGLIAEAVYQVIPELVSLDEHGKPYGIKYTKLTAYLIECIKDLQTQIDQLKKDQ